VHVSDITRILQAVDEGEPRAAAELLPLVYEELRRLAAAKMASQPPGQTLQATALVHEAYLRLVSDTDRTWQNRRHFFATAAAAMRHILVDRARSKAAARHGGGHTPAKLDDVVVASDAPDEGVLLVDESLAALAARDPEAAKLVTLRFFGGFTLIEAADLLGVSERTAKRMWAYARAWLFTVIQKSKSDPD
jgi:RNA polymerase sigma factor (TIGR02999 family)